MSENSTASPADGSIAPSSSTPAATTLTHGPSRREVTLDFADSRGSIEIRSPEGVVELRITLTEQGPVLSVSAASIRLEAVDTLALSCRRFEVDAQEAMTLKSAGQIQLAAKHALQMNGEQLFLNCDQRFIEDTRK